MLFSEEINKALHRILEVSVMNMPSISVFATPRAIRVSLEDGGSKLTITLPTEKNKEAFNYVLEENGEVTEIANHLLHDGFPVTFYSLTPVYAAVLRHKNIVKNDRFKELSRKIEEKILYGIAAHTLTVFEVTPTGYTLREDVRKTGLTG